MTGNDLFFIISYIVIGLSMYILGHWKGMDKASEIYEEVFNKSKQNFEKALDVSCRWENIAKKLMEEKYAYKPKKEDYKMEIKIKYHTDIESLEYIGGDKSNWIDLRAAEDVFIPIGEYCLISLGVSMELPEGYEAHIVPRSSTFKNFGIIQTNHMGVIDHSYEGDGDIWHFPAYCLVGKDVFNGQAGTLIRKNDRICQFRIVKRQPDFEFVTVDELGNADRGGIGSTGVK